MATATLPPGSLQRVVCAGLVRLLKGDDSGRQIRRASRDEPALQGEVFYPSQGSYRKSDNRASKAVGSTPGDLYGLSARTRQGSNPLFKAQQESAAGIVVRRQARLVRHSKAERRSNG